MKDAETYPRLGAAVSSFFDPNAPAGETMIHVRPTSEPFKAFEAPTTEIALFTLNEGVDKGEAEQLVDAVTKAMNAAGSADGVVHAAWGPTVEKDDVIALFIGWTSVDVGNVYLLQRGTSQMLTSHMIYRPITRRSARTRPWLTSSAS